MKITLKQYGGIAPVARPPMVLDTSDLGAAREEVEGLARAVSTQPGSSGAPHPDEMSYTLIIASDAGRQEVRGNDTTATPEFSSLVQQVRNRGKIGA